ncbi:hypothetical protein HY450_02915 [Candidatus Pacearchaeota archaeon]|nr:hypothetical protein [Candidatus Pacearchaeota archaeon]
MGVKNLWSLNIDELLVADKLKHIFNKEDYEVFFPLNSQLKNIDLILLNLKKNKYRTIQVKGSRTYNPTSKEIEEFGNGSGAWINLTKKSVFEPSNKIDFYIFVLHSLEDGMSKKEIRINYLIIPYKDFKKIVSKKQLRRNGTYHFFIWIDDKGKRSFDFNNIRKQISLTKYLNSFNFLSENFK